MLGKDRLGAAAVTNESKVFVMLNNKGLLLTHPHIPWWWWEGKFWGLWSLRDPGGQRLPSGYLLPWLPEHRKELRWLHWFLKFPPGTDTCHFCLHFMGQSKSQGKAYCQGKQESAPLPCFQVGEPQCLRRAMMTHTGLPTTECLIGARSLIHDLG